MFLIPESFSILIDMTKKLLLGFLLFSFIVSANAQIHFSGNPSLLTRNVDALLTINMSNTASSSVLGEIHIMVTEERTGYPICRLQSNKINVPPGTRNLVPYRTQFNKQFFENALSRIAQNTGSFAPGDYLICCQFDPDDKALIAQNPEQCFSSLVTAKAPLLLIYPEDSICNFRPSFQWQGRKTPSSQAAFRVFCAEVSAQQTPEQALQINPPVVQQLIYTQINQIPFPAGSPSLVPGKTYAWQVLEVAGNAILNSSEIYVFTVGCKEAIETSNESYAEVKPIYTGKKYFYRESVNFSFTNPYAAGKLSYAIIRLKDNKKLTNLPSIQMTNGLNKIVLPVADLTGLQKNEQYKIEIYNLASTTCYLNFIIQE
jgi:hypothetical protein